MWTKQYSKTVQCACELTHYFSTLFEAHSQSTQYYNMYIKYISHANHNREATPGTYYTTTQTLIYIYVLKHYRMTSSQRE